MTSRKSKKLLLVLAATILAYVFLVPLLFMIFTSFKTLSESISSSELLPKLWTMENYISILKDTATSPIIRWFVNTVIVTVVGTIATVAVDCLAAYALARLNLPGKKKIVLFLVWVMTIPGIVTLFPAFYLFKQAALINTYLPLVLPYTANATGVYLIYNFLIDFPVSLEEAAKVDGAGVFRIFVVIVLPCIRPIILTLAFITFLNIYNDYLWPSLVVSVNEMKTLTVGIASLVLGANFVNPGLMMAATVFAVLPALILFLFLNKYIVRGDTNAGIK